jgi:ABC-type lipoprotein release transport system permease subunit
VALRSVLARIVFGVGPSDPAVIAGASLLMAAVALLACWFPARRAMNVDSMAALRME